MLKLGEVIKQEAHKKGLTQADIAKLLGLNQSAVAKIYQKNDMKVSTLKKLCLALKISLNRVVKESDI